MMTASVKNMLVTSIDTTLETGVVPTQYIVIISTVRRQSHSDSRKLVSNIGSSLVRLLISAWDPFSQCSWKYSFLQLLQYFESLLYFFEVEYIFQIVKYWFNYCFFFRSISSIGIRRTYRCYTSDEVHLKTYPYESCKAVTKYLKF